MLKSTLGLLLCALCLYDPHTAFAGNNNGAAFSIWPDTGQTTCYDIDGNILAPCPAEGQDFYGQDAQYAGPAQSYTKLNAAGDPLSPAASSWVMVRDNVTGLIWEAKTTDGSIHDKDNSYTWCDTNPDTNGGNQGTCGANNTEDDFLAVLNGGSGFAGHTDWRLPTINELKTLAHRGQSNPAINTTFFPNTVTGSKRYLSSTSNAKDPNLALKVTFNTGGVDSSDKSESQPVRAVRGGQIQPDDRFVISSDGQTVIDMVTCLQWQRATAGLMDWENALSYAEGLSLGGGYTDWRLPNINELASIMDYSRYSPAIDTTAFPNTLSECYWSSTTFIIDPKYAWRLDFDDSEDNAFSEKKVQHAVRAVRAGECGGPVDWWIVSAAVGANGSLSNDTPSPQVVADGSIVQFTFNADRGYYVASVSGCGINYANTDNSKKSYSATTAPVTSDCTVTATFGKSFYWPMFLPEIIKNAQP